MDSLDRIMDELSAALNDASFREEELGRAVDHWLDQARDPSMTEAVRQTYLECAEDVTKIYGRDGR